MLEFPGYLLREKIYESANSLIYRGIRESDGARVVCKLLKEDFPSPGEINRYRQEYRLLAGLTVSGVVRPYALENYRNGLLLVLEDFGGESLRHLLAQHTEGLPLEECLRLMIKITVILGEVHAANIIHKDINPSNIVYSPDTDILKLIDFGQAQMAPRESPGLRHPERLEGSLAYISPEQTGRTHRGVDYRSDFYSLGVTFYELLTGRLPFIADNPMELVHAHLARQPVPPDEVNKSVPRMVAAIVMKLLAKAPEERYQSAWGLLADLRPCLKQWRALGQIPEFPLAARDASDKLRLPDTLFGREAETLALREAFERTSYGHAELVLLKGDTGVGKSSLAQSLYPLAAGNNAYFAAGRFEQYQSGLPYAGILAALRELLRQVLAEDEARVHAWKAKLLAAAGSNARLLYEAVPELEWMLGQQPAVQELGPAEAQNRLQLLLLHIFQHFCQPGAPLVLFLDNLHWCDPLSLKFLQLLLGDGAYLLLIGAFCEQRARPGDPLWLAREEWRKQNGLIVSEIALSPLAPEAVRAYLAACLGSSVEAVAELANLVSAKTQGNPFFMGEFLKSLYADKLLSFDFQATAWRWDVRAIERRGITDNVVELLVGQVRKLPEKTRQVLQWAACLGQQCALNTLAAASGLSEAEVAAEISAAVAAGLLTLSTSSGQAHSASSGQVSVDGRAEDAFSTVMRFIHEHVQQAAYALIPEAERPALHLSIGRRLLAAQPIGGELPPFAVADQFNLGRQLISSQAEKDDVALLNLLAGQQIKASAAYQAAAAYLRNGLALTGENGWQRAYPLCLTLHQEAAEAACLNGEFDQMEFLASAVSAHATELLDEAKVFEVRIQAYSAQNRLIAAIETAGVILKRLGLRLPDTPRPRHLWLARLEMKLALGHTRIEHLVNLPPMKDPYRLATVRILSAVSYAAFRARPALMELIVYKLITLSLKYGNTPLSPYAYATHGQHLCAIGDDIATGYRYGSLALSLVEQHRELAARTGFIVHGFIRYWREPLKDTLEPLLAAHQRGLENGDLVFAANAAFVYLVHSYFLGRDLKLCEREMSAHGEAIAQIKQKAALLSTRLYRQVVLNLLGEGEDNGQPYHLHGDSYDERKMLAVHREANDRTALFQLAFNKLVLSYLFGAQVEALENVARAEEYLNATVGSLPSTLFYFYASLVYLAVYPDLTAARAREVLRKVRQWRKKLKHWARHAPMNFLHKYYLVEAELARVQGQDREARDCYDQAVQLAQEHGFLNDEALAYELAGRFYLSRKLNQFAQLCLHNAHYAYARWGAQAKVKDLAARYPRIFVSTDLGAGLTVTTTRTSSALDLASVLKASQTIAGELLLKRLEDKLMQVVVENAGAQNGFLLLPEQSGWTVEARWPQESPATERLEDSLPLSVIHYVARTRESVVLTDASGSGKFARDPYILRLKPKSVLCMPLLNQGQVAGIVYLENNLASGAFTADRLEVLNLLSAQMVVSLENARLYTRLEEKVAERTRELHEKNEVLVRLNQDKNEFLGIAAHDLKNPLSAIRGLADGILEYYDTMPKEEVLEYAGMICKASQKMFQLITNLLDVNAIESGKINVNLHRVDVLPLLREIAEDYRQRAAAKEIVLHFQAEAESYPAIVDENTFQQVMDNLVSNAVKYSPPGKQTFVRLRQVNGRVRCEVQDQGPGLNEADKAKLFGKFNRLSARPTGGEHSTGLGLFIVKKLVEAMHGEVWCESEPGQGAMFVAEFPAG